jgi:hypothetical protein
VFAILGGLLLGVLLGLRHAFEPDRLVAVSTLVADGQSPRRGAMDKLHLRVSMGGATISAGTRARRIRFCVSVSEGPFHVAGAGALLAQRIQL